MSLEIKQKHQFYSGKYDVTFVIFKLSNREFYIDIEQINSLFTLKFDEWEKIVDAKTDDLCTDINHKIFKSIQYFDPCKYKTSEEFEKDMIIEIKNVKLYFLMYIFPYIWDSNKDFATDLLQFYNSLI